MIDMIYNFIIIASKNNTMLLYILVFFSSCTNITFFINPPRILSD